MFMQIKHVKRPNTNVSGLYISTVDDSYLQQPLPKKLLLPHSKKKITPIIIIHSNQSLSQRSLSQHPKFVALISSDIYFTSHIL